MEKRETYGSYLKVGELTSLQIPLSSPPHHDEMLFIVIHQAYELWFKLLLHELEELMARIERKEFSRARHTGDRVNAIMRLLVDQIHILETLEPVEFAQFRSRLAPASGFQSEQFRALEATLGLTRHQSRERNLRRVFFETLNERLPRLPNDIERVVELYNQRDQHLDLYLLAESLITTDQLLSLWREHHVSVVERVIGRKRGTGGSEGVEYLKTTTQFRCFPELWDARTRLGPATPTGY